MPLLPRASSVNCIGKKADSFIPLVLLSTKLAAL